MKEFLISGGRAVLPDVLSDPMDILVRNGKIALMGGGLSFGGSDTIDASGLMVAPGLIDIHIHGAAGWTSNSPTRKGMDEMSLALARFGTTAFLPTIMTQSFDATLSALSVIADCRGDVSGAEILGIHMEGPYINPKMAGAQNQGAIRGYRQGELEAYIDSSQGCLRIMGLAPEMPGGMELIEELSINGIIPGAVHTDSDFDTATEAVGMGLGLTCHTFNAMRPIHHRDPGIAVAALLLESLFTEFIADGFHVSIPILEMAYRLKGPEKMILVSDAVAVVGLEDGDHEISGTTLTLEGGKVTLKGGHVLAGGAMPLLAGVRNLHEKSEIPLPHIVRAASLNPTTLLGVDDRLGSIAEGKDATLLLLNEDLEVLRVWVCGREIEIPRDI